jgi:hypothetical protein
MSDFDSKLQHIQTSAHNLFKVEDRETYIASPVKGNQLVSAQATAKIVNSNDELDRMMKVMLRVV